ncbi:hypothetical protein QYM36_009717 [Artemia franciscana]|uniref:Uncharacterized protein n=1 Tax=Artemia franciscana TaxID=6661 RepID=A0AA88HL61_ARTSF|nr:hypothetical protein QYM36_009717 [Artemia franciscana]
MSDADYSDSNEAQDIKRRKIEKKIEIVPSSSGSDEELIITSQKYFSIQDISCDAYFTNDAPTCIDAKADTTVTSLPFFTGEEPRSDKVVRNIIIGTSPSKFGNQSGSRMFVRNCQLQSRLVESEQGTTNMTFWPQSIPPSMDNAYMSDSQVGLQENPGPYPSKRSTQSIKITIQGARKLGCG